MPSPAAWSWRDRPCFCPRTLFLNSVSLRTRLLSAAEAAGAPQPQPHTGMARLVRAPLKRRQHVHLQFCHAAAADKGDSAALGHAVVTKSQERSGDVAPGAYRRARKVCAPRASARTALLSLPGWRARSILL